MSLTAETLNAEILNALKQYISLGDTDDDLKGRLEGKLGLTSDDAVSYLTAAHAAIDAQKQNPPPVVAVNHGPEWQPAHHDDIDLATLDAEELGLDPTDENEIRLADAIEAAKLKAKNVSKAATVITTDLLLLVPVELKARQNWLRWKLEQVNGRLTKVPYQVNGSHADATASRDWNTYEAAVKDVVLDETQGVGIATDGTFTGFDLDGCRNPTTGEITKWAKRIIDLLGSYCEITPSGYGVRVYAFGSLPDGPRRFSLAVSAGFGDKVGIETYSEKRYFTITGNRLGEISTLQSLNVLPAYELCRAISREFPSEGRKSAGTFQPNDSIGSSSVVLEQSPGFITSKLAVLMYGKIVSTAPFVIEDENGSKVSAPSQSEADMSLATLLAMKHEGDASAIDSDFRESSLYRSKWDRLAENTIKKAIESAKRIKEKSEALVLNQASATAPTPTQAPAEWPPLLPVEDVLSPVEKFNADFLPDAIRPWVEDVSERMSVPLDFAGICAVVTLAGITGRRVFVYPKKNDKEWKEAICLPGAVVADSGKTKTPTWRTFVNLLVEKDADWHDEYKKRTALYDVQLENWEETQKQNKEIQKAIAKGKNPKGEIVNTPVPEKPKPRRRCILTDTTPEKMQDVLKDNPEGILFYRDELSSWVAEFEKEGRENQKGLFLAATNGNEYYDMARMGREGGGAWMCASVFGGFQPALFRAFIGVAKHTDDGTIPRFPLIVWPDEATLPKIDRCVNEGAKYLFRRIIRILADMGVATIHLHFDPQAQEIYNEWSDQNDVKITSEEHPGKRSHLSKYKGTLPKIAGLFQLVDLLNVVGAPAVVAVNLENGEQTIDNVNVSLSGNHLIDAEHIQKAIRFLAYLELHMHRIYDCISDPILRAELALAKRIKDREIKNSFAIRDVLRKGWSHLDQRTIVEYALYNLKEKGWLRDFDVLSGVQGGRPTVRWQINPALNPQ